MISKGIPFQLAVLAGVSFFLAGALCFASVRHLRRSAEAYVRAVEMQKRLEAQPVRVRTAAGYKRVINEFRSVYWYDFANPKAPVAAETMGDLYVQMGRAFSNPRYFHDAIKAYNYVISQYPVSSMALDSALSVGKVYLKDLHDPSRAAEVFRSFLEKHPSTPQAEQARRSLKEISDMLSERRQRTTNSASALEKSNPTRPVEIRGIHDWAGPGSTRLVIKARGAFKYNTFRLDHPDRIVFDLPNTYLPRSLLGKVIPINDDFLENIRVAQFTPSITRIVLDLKNFENYSAFSLTNPFRLIIDVHGRSTGAIRERAYRKASSLPTTNEPGRAVQVSSRGKVPGAKRLPQPTTRPEIEEANQLKRNERRKAEAASLDVKVPATKRASVVSPRHGSKAVTHAMSHERNTEVASIRKLPDEIPISIRPASPTVNGSETLTRALGLKVTRIVIDPGHGGVDTGAIGPDGLEEKNVALSIGLDLRKLFEARTDYRVFMTRTTDVFIPLEERTAIANADHADLFISIHCNASPDHHVRGIATYYLNFTTNPQALKVAARENATSQYSVFQLKSLIKKIALNNKIQESQQLASDIQSVLWRRMSRISHGIQNRRVRKAPFVVLIGANMPSVLVETGFITNPHTEHLLSESSYREQIAKGIFHGVVDYIGNLGTFRVAQRTH